MEERAEYDYDALVAQIPPLRGQWRSGQGRSESEHGPKHHNNMDSGDPSILLPTQMKAQRRLMQHSAGLELGRDEL